MPEQAVIVRFAYGRTDLAPLFEIEDKLIAAIENADVGELDGHEVAMDGSDAVFYMYGPDAEKLFEAVRPVLASSASITNPVATIRYGPPDDGVKERQVAIVS